MVQQIRWQRWVRQGLLLFITLWLEQPVVFAKPAVFACTVNELNRSRIGLNVVREGNKRVTDYAVAALGAGWYIDYQWTKTPAQPGQLTYVQMIRSWRNDAAWQQQINAAIDANHGALWVLGNEPDNWFQDRRTPADYAAFYHDAYTWIKQRDPTSRIAIAAMATATPLRFRYLDMVIDAYQKRYGTPLPVDVWNIHVYILPETTDWGAGIPPGLERYAREGRRYTLDDHDNLAVFKTQILAIRRWMAARGYRNKPLVLSEFGILLGPDHGYPHERVRKFLWGSFDFLLNATHLTLGYPADNNHLVQQFAWFSLNDYVYTAETKFGTNGNLFDHDSGQLTALGRDFIAYTHCQH